MTEHYDHQEFIMKDEEYIHSLLTDIGEATKTVDMETYIFKDDLVGRKITEVLCAVAERGVRVRLLVDGIGTLSWGNSLTKKLEKSGVKTRIFHPLPWFISHLGRATPVPKPLIAKISHLFAKINSRNHRKVCIIDNKIAYVGSANITQLNLRREHGGESWHDTTVKLTGIKLQDLQYAFEKAWGHIPIRKRLRLNFKRISPDPIFRLNYSWRRRYVLYKALLKKIMHAKKRIWVMNAYFIPDAFLLSKIKQAAERGIDVRIMLPHKSDILIASLTSLTFYSDLIRGGVKIYEYLPSMLHAKILILDDWYCIGSSNLNYRSLKHDLEVDVNIRTETAKQKLEKLFTDDLKHTRKIELADLKKQPIYKSIFGKLLLFMRYWI